MANKNLGNPKWEKGKSANPSTQFKPGNTASKGHGRKPKLPNLDNLLAKVLGEEFKDDLNALEIILKSLRSKAVRGDIKAVALLMDRAYGKSKQFIEQTNKNQHDLSSLSDEELLMFATIQDKLKKKDESDDPDSVS